MSRVKMHSTTHFSHDDPPPIQMPKVSVIIPAYNTAAFIVEALVSVFAQTFSDFEVIVINDGSQDSDELERAITPYRKRILYLDQDNRGAAGARNTGIRHARGEYLAFLDSDDCWLPDYLSSQMKLFDAMPHLDAVYCDTQCFDDSDKAFPTFMQMYPSNGSVTLEDLIKEECHVPFSCSVARREVVVDAGGFDESLPRCEDYDLWLRILYRGAQMTYQKKVLGRYRFRPGSMSRDSMKVLEALLAIFKKAERIMKLPMDTQVTLKKQIAQAEAHFDLETGRKFLAAGDFDRAKDSLSKANNFFHRAKLKMAILGLQFAPHWTRLAVLTWKELVSGRE
jgi:glycosyltransferase involved in cell wall biosynthesis